MIKPIRVWLTPAGPNPYKVIIVLEELRVPYETKSFTYPEVKKKPFTDINPNGRVPAIEDPNTNLTLWESGAIVQYLVEQHHCNQWLMFQMSGQGPYFGQATWFNFLHAEKIPSAIERYNNEVKRVVGLLDSCLDGKQWLVGDKCTFADLASAPWNNVVGTIFSLPTDQMFDEFPNVKAWHDRITSRPSLMDEQGL
ncbi:glutathione S-transferase [Lophium mytilinum]|uniref:glutathione transferase n=1 Tax=Lophium mytilinum TaxID=390894 RepID=A0A6A6R0P1_9PEZI|nr:glutathione S-transferase [Lophium mytilinum]